MWRVYCSEGKRSEEDTVIGEPKRTKSEAKDRFQAKQRLLYQSKGWRAAAEQARRWIGKQWTMEDTPESPKRRTNPLGMLPKQ